MCSWYRRYAMPQFKRYRGIEYTKNKRTISGHVIFCMIRVILEDCLWGYDCMVAVAKRKNSFLASRGLTPGRTDWRYTAAAALILTSYLRIAGRRGLCEHVLAALKFLPQILVSLTWLQSMLYNIGSRIGRWPQENVALAKSAITNSYR
jgi:hypothetical protein